MTIETNALQAQYKLQGRLCTSGVRTSLRRTSYSTLERSLLTNDVLLLIAVGGDGPHVSITTNAISKENSTIEISSLLSHNILVLT